MIQQIVDKFLQALSSGNFELMRPHVSESVVYFTFMANLQKQGSLQGIDNLKELFVMFVGTPNDGKFQVETITCDYPSAILWGKMVGTIWITPGGIHVEEQFEVRAAFLLTFKHDKIQKIEFRYDTFKLMKLSGITVARSGDKEKIKAYVKMIESLGLLPRIPDN